MITLDIISPDGERQRRSFDAMPISIGRQVGQLRIQDPGVSALHGQLALIDGVLCYRDLGSTNGSFGVDGSPIKSKVNLVQGDRVRLGEHELCLVEFEQALSPAPIPSVDPTKQTMVYPPTRAPWGKSGSPDKGSAPGPASDAADAQAKASHVEQGPASNPTWRANTAPSQEEPHKAAAPRAPRAVPAHEGTIFGRLDSNGELDPSPQSTRGAQTQMLRAPSTRKSAHHTLHVEPPSPKITQQLPSIEGPATTPSIPAPPGPTTPEPRLSRQAPATQKDRFANTSIIASIRALLKQPLRTLASGPWILLVAGGMVLSNALARDIASSLLLIGIVVMGVVSIWSLLPQSIAAAQLLSKEKVTPLANWFGAIGTPASMQAKWIAMLFLLLVSSVLVVPIFLCFPFAAPALLLERKGVVESLRRSASLVSWYPVTAMLPLLFLILSIPLSWLTYQELVGSAQVGGAMVSESTTTAVIVLCATLIALCATIYVVHTFRVFFYHLSTHDPRAPELHPMRRLERIT